jgi:hypothetical protein
LNPGHIKSSLLDLLSGKPILVGKSNFSVFHSIFLALGNHDFNRFFNHIPPEHPTNFYLSINSLKPMPNELVEKKHFEPTSLPGFSIPIGLVRLFWTNYHHHSLTNPQNFFSKRQIQNGVHLLNQMKNGVFCQINQEQFEFLDYFKIHSELIRSLYQSELYLHSSVKSGLSEKPKTSNQSHFDDNSLFNLPQNFESSPPAPKSKYFQRSIFSKLSKQLPIEITPITISQTSSSENSELISN